MSIIDDFPGLRGVGIDRVGAGSLPFTSDQVAIVDELQPGLMVAAGHIFGNSAGPMTGKMISQMLAGRQTDLDMSVCRFERALASVEPGEQTGW